MEDKEFTKDMYKLYLAQRKKLDSAVPKSVREQYIKKEEKYEQFKQLQKERYHQRVAEGGDEFRQKIRDKNNASYRRKKERDTKKQEESEDDDYVSTIPESVSRYSRSITKSNYSVDDDEADLESVFSEEQNPRQLHNHFTPRFIGF
jgi:hypothetical protein